jgi:glutamine synthetase
VDGSTDYASALSTVRHVGDNFEFCTRQALKIMLARLKEMATTIVVGFEIELAIVEGLADAPQPVDAVAGWLDSSALRSKYLTKTYSENGFTLEEVIHLRSSPYNAVDECR